MKRRQSFFSRESSLFDRFFTCLRFRKVIKLIPAGSTVLDMGCGLTGNFLRSVENRILKGVGIDIEVVQPADSAKIKLVKYDLNLGLPFSGDEFDVVISMANLEHLENPGKIMLEINRVLKPGGFLFLTTPTPWAKPVLEFMAFKLKIISPTEISDHKNYFDKKTIFDLCRRAGFSSFRHSYFEFFMNNFLYARK